MANTTKYLIPKMDQNALIKNGPVDVNAALDSIDSKMAGYSEGPLGSRPTSTSGSPGIAGREYYATDTGQRFKDTGTGWYEIQGAGDLKPTARAAAPDGWLLCDGSPVSRTTFAALFAAIGTANGPGDGSTTFNLPDLRGRTPVGAGTAAGDPTAAAKTLGAKGGEEKHPLTVAELAAHAHPHTLAVTNAGAIVTGNESQQHSHDPSDFTGFVTTPLAASLVSGLGVASGSGVMAAATISSDSSVFDSAPGTANNNVGHTHTLPAHGHALSGAVSNAGGDTAHNNMQPYSVVNWLIKT